MAEWSMAAVLKTVRRQRLRGSNPLPSANVVSDFLQELGVDVGDDHGGDAGRFYYVLTKAEYDHFPSAFT